MTQLQAIEEATSHWHATGQQIVPPSYAMVSFVVLNVNTKQKNAKGSLVTRHRHDCNQINTIHVSKKAKLAQWLASFMQRQCNADKSRIYSATDQLCTRVGYCRFSMLLGNIIIEEQ